MTQCGIVVSGQRMFRFQGYVRPFAFPIDKTDTPRVPTNMIRDNYKRDIFKNGQFLWDANALVTKVS